jgi:hypothetical protein
MWAVAGEAASAAADALTNYALAPTVTEQRMKMAVEELVAIFSKYERIWARRPPTKRRKRLVDLIFVLSPIVNPAGILKFRFAAMLAYILQRYKLEFDNCLYLIQMPVHPVGIQVSDETVEADRELVKTSFRDLYELFEQGKQEGTLYEDIKTCMKAFGSSNTDVIPALQQIQASMDTVRGLPASTDLDVQ